MVKFPFRANSTKCVMPVASFPGAMLRPLPLPLVGWGASWNNNIIGLFQLGN